MKVTSPRWLLSEQSFPQAFCPANHSKSSAILNMNSVARIAKSSATVAKRATVSRTFVSTPKAFGGAKHDGHHDAHGHDDHEHHDHPVRSTRKNYMWNTFVIVKLSFLQMWENLPFNKTGMAIMVFGLASLGVGLIVGACEHQQKKQGFKN